MINAKYLKRLIADALAGVMIETKVGKRYESMNIERLSNRIYLNIEKELENISSPVIEQPIAQPAGVVDGCRPLNEDEKVALEEFGEAMRRDVIPPYRALAFSERDWEEGKYANTCTTCKNTFFGHKRQITCRSCASAPHQGEEQ